MITSDTPLSRFGSAHSLFRNDTQQSIRSLKLDGLREGSRASSLMSGASRLRAISRVTWGSLFRGLGPPKEQSLTISEFQQKLHLNSDTVVAVLELVIVLLSCVQLELSSRSPRWRENRACENHPGCSEMLEEGKFLVANCIRVAIGAIGIVRMWVRIRFLFKQRPVPIHDKFWLNKLGAYRMYLWEIIALVMFPYPALEKMLRRDQADIMVLLSIAVGVRTICWRQVLYFPYPIRQKEKVASFSGNLEFSYRAFVFKKVMDDSPVTKFSLMCTIVLTLSAFLVRAIETINGSCYPKDAIFTTPDGVTHHYTVECAALHWKDALWLVTTSFVTLGYGDVVLHSNAGRAVIVFSGFLMRCVTAMLASVIIKKFNFSSMEARVHAFLFRMDLFNKKGLSAVMAVQASFRFNKSYKQSLMWHKHNNSQLYYRPLSTRLPNEVKKKLYVSRFQASLKEIMKFNTDGDPLNSFTKHIEVITAALGITLVEMAQLKKIYYRKSRIQEQRKKPVKDIKAVPPPDSTTTAVRQASVAAPGPTEAQLSSPAGSAPPSPRDSKSNYLSLIGGSSRQLTAPAETPTTTTLIYQRSQQVNVSAEWGNAMLVKCQEVLAQLQRIEHSAKRFDDVDRRSSLTRSLPPLRTAHE